METNQDGSEVLETTEAEETEQTEAEEAPEADEKDKKIAELESKNKQLFERAKKAEEAKKDGVDVNPKDYLALVENKVSSEDYDEVIEFARFKKVSITEALKNPTLKAILAEKTEERKTAEATNTRAPQRGATKTSGQDLLAKAEKTGEVPTEHDDLVKLAEARIVKR